MSFTELEATSAVKEAEPLEDQYSEALRYTAGQLVEKAAKVTPGQKVLIWYDGPGLRLARDLYEECSNAGAEVRFFRRDWEGDAEKLRSISEEEIPQMFNEEKVLMDWAENILIVRNPEDPEAMENVSPSAQNKYNDRYSQVHARRSEGTVKWTLFYYPTEYEAAQQEMPYDEYFAEVMEACNQPWPEVHHAQKILKGVLDDGEVLELFANEHDPDETRRTYVKMSIKGMTFCNSDIDFNYPGSEVFSAPVLDSVEGQIFGAGKYMYSGILMEDIFIRIEKGKIVEARARVNNEGLQQILGRGEGARFFGEVALGTNGGLKRRYFNPLLNEKVAGTFHMAVGHCYEETMYGEDEVNVNNGNTQDKTSVHWDIAIPMHRKPDGSGGGKVVVDGRIIQKDGYFEDERLKILNPKI